MWNHPILETEFLGNSLEAWLLALVVLILTWTGLKIFYLYGIGKIKKVFEKTSTEVDVLFIDAVQAIKWPFYLIISVYISHFFVDLSDWLEKVIFFLFFIGLVYYVIRFLERLVNYGTRRLIEIKQGEGEGIIRFGGSLIRLALWLSAFLMVLANLGINVTSLIAGLGIGGLAIALALQSVLGDLFSSLTILLDKPFKIGDFIVIGDQMGTVEKIGIKTTRIRLLEGEELIVANSVLTSSNVRNFGNRDHRRVVFNVGVVYGTPLKKLQLIPSIIKESIEKENKTEVEFASFKEFGDYSLVFETAFYIYSPAYVEYMETRERINLNIASRFEEEGIDMAFPTTTVHLKK